MSKLLVNQINNNFKETLTLRNLLENRVKFRVKLKRNIFPRINEDFHCRRLRKFQKFS